MKHAIILSLLLWVAASHQAMADDAQLEKLDDAISKREYYTALKLHRIDSLKNLIADDSPTARALDIYNQLYGEYLAFNFDSTMIYVDKAAVLAMRTGDYATVTRVNIHRALSLATSGHFSHAIAILDTIDSKRLPTNIKEEYFAACEWSYGAWAEFSDKRTISPEFSAKSMIYLDSLIAVTQTDTPEYSYRIAERDLRSKNYHEAEKHYLATLGRIPVACRLYAQSAYALALTYKALGNNDKYKEWLINAAISDQVVPLKENLALQQLALFIKSTDGDLAKANHYLKIALDDAIFYNNRLRMVEIAEKIPDIVNDYQNAIEEKNDRLSLYILIIGVLVLLLAGAVAFVQRQRQKVSKSKNDLSLLYDKLRLLNQQLSHTNDSREKYVSLFMDLCAAYIDKLNRFPVILKLKVKQISDIASVADRYIRPSETETKEMFFNFDSAFLRLYPDFIAQFNSLLKDDCALYPKKGELLNTDLRIYALIRMGITDSNKIATLLFLSPQTIFNHRSQVRNRAIRRDSFENEIANICPTMPG
ncbi:MAG: DUF6377 domain-containing protein [Muribaculaceae bacterium]